MRRLWQTFKAVRRLIQYPTQVPAWTEEDQNSLNVFLNQTPAGRKLRDIVATTVLNQSQQVIGDGGKDFDCGIITGMRYLWVSIETLSAGVAPEGDQTDNE